MVPSRISNWETGANCPTIDILFEVCDILNVSINNIYGVYPDSKFVLEYGEQDLLKKYRLLDDDGKETVDFILDKEYKRCSTKCCPAQLNAWDLFNEQGILLNAAHANDYANDPEELKSLEETISEKVKTNIIKFTDVKDAKKFLEGQKISAFITSKMTDNSILEIANVLYNNSKNKYLLEV